MKNGTRPLYANGNNGNGTNNGKLNSALCLKRLEYGVDGKPAYAEYDGYGKLLSYTPVEEKNQWKPMYLIICAAITAVVAFYAITGYLKDREYAQEKAKFMEHAVLTGWNVDYAAKAWDRIQNAPDEQP